MPHTILYSFLQAIFLQLFCGSMLQSIPRQDIVNNSHSSTSPVDFWWWDVLVQFCHNGPRYLPHISTLTWSIVKAQNIAFR